MTTQFTKLIKQITQSGELNSTQQILLSEIASLSQQKGYCWASNSHLAKETGKSISTIKQSLKVLKDKGFILIDNKKVPRRITIAPKYHTLFENIKSTSSDNRQRSEAQKERAIRERNNYKRIITIQTMLIEQLAEKVEDKDVVEPIIESAKTLVTRKLDEDENTMAIEEDVVESLEKIIQSNN